MRKTMLSIAMAVGFSGMALAEPAKVMVPAAEHAFWMDDARMAAAPAGMKGAFENARRTFATMPADTLVRFEAGNEVAPGIQSVAAYGHTPGHTPGHMSVRLESGGAHALFVCDLATYAVHFVRLGWMTAYDVEPLVTLETKRRWGHWALEHDALEALLLPAGIPEGRYFAYRRAG